MANLGPTCPKSSRRSDLEHRYELVRGIRHGAGQFTHGPREVRKHLFKASSHAGP
jgi:hypothetical protein